MIDHTLFDKIYADTYQDVLKYVICKCSNIEDVNDIIQNIYVDLYKKIFNINIDNINNYILGIAKNKVNDYYRFKYKNKLISLFSSKQEKELLNRIPTEHDIEKELIIKEDLELIWEFLKNKKVIIAKVFYLYYYLGLSIKEISIELNITESNVKHYLYRTLKELNICLEKSDKYE